MDQIRFVLECDQEVADEVAAALTREAHAQVSSASKRNLDGSAETIMQIIQVASSFGGLILPLLLPWLKRDSVRKIRFGELEIENPTPEQVETLWQRYLEDTRRDASSAG